MTHLCSCVAPILLSISLGTTTAAGDMGPFAFLRSFIDPSTDTQAGTGQGYSVALDGNIAVVGAPYDDVGAYESGVVKVYDVTTGALMHTLTNPSPASSDYFGRAVSVSGSRVIVGAYGDDIGAPGSGSAYLYDLTSATPALPIAALTNPVPAINARFGFAVAVSGTRAVVTAAYSSAEANYSGRAYVYELTATSGPTPFLVLTNPSPASDDAFGYAAAISGTRLVIGTRAHGDIGENAVHVYDLTKALPALPMVTLVNPAAGPFDSFASAVAIFDDKVVVGADGDDTGALNAGVAHVYDLGSPSPDLPVLTLTNPAPASFAQFGFAVAISGSRVAVGAIGPEEGYVFDLDGATPTVPTQIMTNPTGVLKSGFAGAAAISGTRLLLGAPGDGGGVYVYDLVSPTPSAPVATLNSPSPASGRYFGRAVAISSNRIVVGTSPIGGANLGIVYVYDWANSSAVSPVLVLTNPAPQTSDFFATAVAMHGTRIVIGAYGDDSAGINSGRVFVYDLAGATPAVPALTLTNPAPADHDNFGYTVAMSGTRVAVGAWHDDHGAEDAGSVYVYDLSGAAPAVPAYTLHNPHPSPGDWFGLAVAIDGTRVVVGAQRDDAGATDAGRAYVYDLTRPNPTTPFITMNNPNPEPQDFFGSAVAIAGSRVVVGADWDAAGANYSGSAYVYHLDAPNPSLPFLTLTNPSPAVNDYFGESVAISGPYVVIGAASDDSGATDAGVVYVYDAASLTPSVPVGVLTRPGVGDYDYFGGAVAIENDTIVVGARGVDTTAAARGAADIFVLRPQLSITSAAPNQVILSWTPADPGFVLQYADDISGTNWMNAPGGALTPVSLSVTNAARFYRLFRP